LVCVYIYIYISSNKKKFKNEMDHIEIL